MNLMILSFDHNTDDETSENENGQQRVLGNNQDNLLA